MADKDPQYIRELSQRREKSPKEFEMQKDSYDAAKKQESEDKNYSALETIKKVAKKAVGMKSGGSVSSASKRADGCAMKGKTKGRMV